MRPDGSPPVGYNSLGPPVSRIRTACFVQRRRQRNAPVFRMSSIPLFWSPCDWCRSFEPGVVRARFFAERDRTSAPDGVYSTAIFGGNEVLDTEAIKGQSGTGGRAPYWKSPRRRGGPKRD